MTLQQAFFILQIQEQEVKVPFTGNLDSSSSLLAHFSPSSNSLHSHTEEMMVRWKLCVIDLHQLWKTLEESVFTEWKLQSDLKTSKVTIRGVKVNFDTSWTGRSQIMQLFKNSINYQNSYIFSKRLNLTILTFFNRVDGGMIKFKIPPGFLKPFCEKTTTHHRQALGFLSFMKDRFCIYQIFTRLSITAKAVFVCESKTVKLLFDTQTTILIAISLKNCLKILK